MIRSERGFTLLETLIATVIFAGGIMVLANAWSGNFMRVRNARVNNTMAALLERKMTEVEIQYRGKPLNEIQEEAAGDFGAKYPGYRWTMKSQPFEMPDMSSSLVSREGGADEMVLTLVRTMGTFIKDVVKEVSVNVYYKARSGREVRHTVTTYFIDYSKDMQLPGMP